jgi:signal transduction histidine kinase
MAYEPLLQRLYQIILHSASFELLLAETAQALIEAFQAETCLLFYPITGQVTVQVAGWSRKNSDASALLKAEVEVTPLVEWPAGTPVVLTASPTDSGTGNLPPEPLDLLNLCQSLLQQWQLPPVQSSIGIRVNSNSAKEAKSGFMLMRSGVNPWTASEIKTVEAVANLVAIILAQSAHIQSTQMLQQQVYLASQSQTLSQELLGNLHRALELDRLLQLALDTTAHTLRVDRALLLLIKYDAPNFKLSLTSPGASRAKVTLHCEWQDFSTLDRDIQPQPVPRSHNAWFWLSDCQLCQQVLTDRPETLSMSDLRLMPQGIDWTQVAEIFAVEQFPALIISPLLAPPGSLSPILGFWILQCRQPRPWGALEQKFIESVAAQASTVIIHNQALRQVQSLIEERTTQLEHNQRIQSKLYEVTRQQVEQLRQLNQLKDEFISTLSHELRTPLTSMKLAIQMLRQPGLSPDRAAKYLDILEQQWAQEANLINDLLLLQELESSDGGSQLCATPISGLIEELTPLFSGQWAAKDIHLSQSIAADVPDIRTDPQGLRRVLKELLTNAGKFANPSTTVYLSLQTQETDHGTDVVLQLTNTGLGILPQEQSHIFEKFRRGQGVTQKAIPGVGLGLALVKNLVHQLRGQIEVSSHLVDGSAWETSFTVTLMVNPDAAPADAP